MAGVDRCDPLRRPVRRLRYRPPSRAARMGSARVRRTRVEPGRGHPDRPLAHRAAEAPPVRVISTLPCLSSRCRMVAAGGSMLARTRPAGSGCASAGRRRHRDRTACGSPRAGWLPAYALASFGQGDRHLRPRGTTPTTRTVVHLPRLSLRRGRGRHRAPRRLGRRHQLGRHAAQSFACSDPMLERLHANVVWSFRDNFVSVPTDCPQRDERLGWTGDAQAFASTASLLVDSRAFWSSWLRDLALEQDPVLGVSTVVPDVVVSGEPRFGRAGWSDAATIVPSAVYEAYGDRRDPPRPSFAAARPCRLARRPARVGRAPARDVPVRWLADLTPSDRPWLAKADGRYLANAFLVHSAGLAAKAAPRTRPRLVWPSTSELSRRTWLRRTWTAWSGHALTTQTRYAVALESGSPRGWTGRASATPLPTWSSRPAVASPPASFAHRSSSQPWRPRAGSTRRT